MCGRSWRKWRFDRSIFTNTRWTLTFVLRSNPIFKKLFHNFVTDRCTTIDLLSIERIVFFYFLYFVTEIDLLIYRRNHYGGRRHKTLEKRQEPSLGLSIIRRSWLCFSLDCRQGNVSHVYIKINVHSNRDTHTKFA